MSNQLNVPEVSQQSSQYLAESELRPTGRAARPRDSATLILVRRDKAEAQILMGKRSANHAFMPNKFVFPGGKVDSADARIKPPYDLHPDVLARLMLGCSANRARALAMAAVRETFEETGITVGENGAKLLKTRSRAWRAFLQQGMNPRLDTLHFIARAITPAYRNRRFDSRFFMADADPSILSNHRPKLASGELLEIHWVTLKEARQLELPRITRLVLDEIEQRIVIGHQYSEPGPFVFFRRGKAIREHQ